MVTPGRRPVRSKIVPLEFMGEFDTTIWQLPALTPEVVTEVCSKWYTSNAAHARIHHEDAADVDRAWDFVNIIEDALVVSSGMTTKDHFLPVSTDEQVLAVLQETADKSPGDPWSLRYQTKGEIPPDEIRLAAERALSVYQSTHVVPALCRLFPKDELIKRSKAQEGRYRMIVNVPVEILWVMARLDHAWHQATMRFRPLGPYIVGINAFSAEWDYLARRHLQKSIHVELDLSGAEFRFTQNDFHEILKMRRRYLAPAEHVWCDFLEAFFTQKVLAFPDGRLTHCCNLNPSGHHGTSQYTNRVMLRIVAAGLYAQGLSPFDTVMSIYGDNALLSFDADLGFDLQRFLAYVALAGYPMKAGEPSPDIGAVSMLSHRFNRHYGRYYPSTDRPEKMFASVCVQKLEAVNLAADLERHKNKLLSISFEFVFAPNEQWEKFRAKVRLFVQHVLAVAPKVPWLTHLISLDCDQRVAIFRHGGLQSACAVRSEPTKLTPQDFMSPGAKKAQHARTLRRAALRRGARPRMQRPKTRIGKRVMKLLGGRGPRKLTMRTGSQVAAPVAFGTQLPRTSISFLGTARHAVHGDGVRIRFITPMASLGIAASAAAQTGALIIGGATYGVTAVDLGAGVTRTGNDTTEKYFESKQLGIFVQQFAKYQYHSLRVTYYPTQATTASSRDYYMAQSSDPAYFRTITPNLAQIMTMQGVVHFSSWQSAAMDIPVDGTKVHFQQVFAAGAPTDSDTRLDYVAGLCALAGYQNYSTSNIMDGILYLSGEITVYGFLGDQVNPSSLLRRLEFPWYNDREQGIQHYTQMRDVLLLAAKQCARRADIYYDWTDVTCNTRARVAAIEAREMHELQESMNRAYDLPQDPDEEEQKEIDPAVYQPVVVTGNDRPASYFKNGNGKYIAMVIDPVTGRAKQVVSEATPGLANGTWYYSSTFPEGEAVQQVAGDPNSTGSPARNEPQLDGVRFHDQIGVVPKGAPVTEEKDTDSAVVVESAPPMAVTSDKLGYRANVGSNPQNAAAGVATVVDASNKQKFSGVIVHSQNLTLDPEIDRSRQGTYNGGNYIGGGSMLYTDLVTGVSSGTPQAGLTANYYRPKASNFQDTTNPEGSYFTSEDPKDYNPADPANTRRYYRHQRTLTGACVRVRSLPPRPPRYLTRVAPTRPKIVVSQEVPDGGLAAEAADEATRNKLKAEPSGPKASDAEQ